MLKRDKKYGIMVKDLTHSTKNIQKPQSDTCKSKYAQHILEIGDAYGNLQDTMYILKLSKNDRCMSELEKCYVQKGGTSGIHISNALLGMHNPVFKILCS